MLLKDLVITVVAAGVVAIVLYLVLVVVVVVVNVRKHISPQRDCSLVRQTAVFCC